MRFHGVCDLFPEMSDEEFKELVADIKARGVQVPVATYQGAIIDGKHRWKACQELGIECPTVEWDGSGSLVEHVVALNLKRRHLSQSQKAALAVELLPMLEKEAADRMREAGRAGGTSTAKGTARIPEASAGESREKAAAVVHVAPRYVSDAKKLKADAPATFARVRSGELTIPEAKKEVAREAREVARTTIPDDLPTNVADRCQLIVADLSLASVADESIDWIITDPPYPHEFLPVYEKLVRFAETKLKPAGSILCMIGQSYLPEILRLMESKTVKYRWTLAYMTPGAHTQLWERKINCAWKPIIWFTKNTAPTEWAYDVTRSDGPDKDHHGWGQSESGMADLMRRFVKPGDVVCDPFLGGGTTAVVALSLNCRFIGIDIDHEAVKTTRGRLHDVAK